MKGKKRCGQTDTFLADGQKKGVEEEAESQKSARDLGGGGDLEVVKEEGGEEGSGGFSHPCICPLRLLGCFVCV